MIKKIESYALYIGAAVLIAMTGHTAADVILRNLTNQPIEGTYETVTFWYMVAVTGLGLWAAEVKGDHISVSLFTDRLSAPARFLQTILVRTVTILFLAALAWYGFQSAFADTAIRAYTGASEIAIWPTKYFLPLGMVAFAVVLGSKILQQLRTRSIYSDSTDEFPEAV